MCDTTAYVEFVLLSEGTVALVFRVYHLKDLNLFLQVSPSPLSCVRTMPLFRSSPKSPQELVKSLDEALKVLKGAETGGKKAEKASSCACVRVCGI